MKILIVIHYFPPHIGGMEEVSKSQAGSLAALGHDVVVLTCRHDRRVPAGESTGAGYRVRRFRALNFIESRFGVTFPIVSPSFIWSAYREARDADVVHIHDVFYPTSHSAALATRLAGKPFVMTQHVALVDFPNRLVMAAQRIVYRLAGRPMLRAARTIVTYNDNVRSFVTGMGIDPDKVLLNHNGVDTGFFAPCSPTERLVLRERHLPASRPIVLFVGRLVPKKGYDIAYRARSEGYLTVIVGNGYVETGISDDEDVRFFGPADRDQLQDLYRLSDVFVFPAVGEIFTLVMQEAMACGLPVVTTDDPGYAGYDLDRSRVALVERSAEAVRAALTRIVSDPDLAHRMSGYSRELAVQRFSWDANYPREFAIYGAPAQRTEENVR